MTKFNPKPNLPAIVFAVAALTSIHPSIAFANDDTKTELVRYGDLDLASKDGVKTFDRRLDRAVKRVCGTEDYPTDLEARAQGDACEREARVSLATQRNYAIAQATGHGGPNWADNASRQPTKVAISE